MRYRSLNPATEELIETYPDATSKEIEAALDQSDQRFHEWRKTDFETRSRWLQEVAELLDSDAEPLAALMATEMGKPLAEGRAEASKCAWACRYFAQGAEELLRPDLRTSDGSEAFVRYDPLGPILAIMPWNFPFWQFFRFAAPALMAGNTVLLKHAPNTPRCALRLIQLLDEAGMPAHLVQSLFLTHEQVPGVIADSRVRGVTLTGSTTAGRGVAAEAGRRLKPMVMELGGSDPFIVLEDADLDLAVATGVQSRCLNSGQSCIAAKRFLIHRSRFDEFAERFVGAMQARVMGDPFDPEVDIGPLAREDLRDRLVDQVTRSVEAGAEALCGATAHDGRGFFYPPTVLSNVPPASPAADEELFGPVATLIPFKNDAEAIAIANATPYGLGASLWSRDIERLRRWLPELDTGNVFVNGLVKSDPRLAFGGVKASGFGRELAREGLLEFVNAKTIWLR